MTHLDVETLLFIFRVRVGEVPLQGGCEIGKPYILFRRRGDRLTHQIVLDDQFFDAGFDLPVIGIECGVPVQFRAIMSEYVVHILLHHLPVLAVQ